MKHISLFFFSLFFISLGFAQPIVYVTPSGAGDHSGTSWTNALPGVELPNRVVSASSGTQFWVASGKYKPTLTTDRTASFSIASGVSVYGGFAGTETALEQRIAGSNETRFSGDIMYDESSSESNSQHIISLINSKETITLDGLTICLGNTLTSDYGNSGAGIYVELTNTSLNLILSNCRIQHNTVRGSLSGGGGIGIIAKTNSHCHATFKNCYFFNNYGGFGGAYTPQTLGGTITSVIEDCEFYSNLGYNESGAISNRYVDDSVLNSLTIRRCNFSHNGALYRAGAITTGSSLCLIENSVFNSNVAAGYFTNDSKISYGNGGAIDGSGSTSIYKNCLFVNNKASNGGAIYSNSEDRRTEQTFINCTFTKDSAVVAGSVFANLLYEGVQKSPFIYNSNVTKVINCLISGNTSPDEAIFISQAWVSFESDRIYNSLIATYSLIQGNYPGTGNINTDPLFVDITNSDYRLLPNSPAINAGDPNTTDLPDTDLAGQLRIQGGRVDMGAYEFFSCLVAPCTPLLIQKSK